MDPNHSKSNDSLSSKIVKKRGRQNVLTNKSSKNNKQSKQFNKQSKKN